ncbi:MAG: tetratricopeptide repeat protein, partial [Chloroflexi bacterium]|nr:tetratricopeptide repeat protein [Chloroflexota bacterium]
YLTRGDLDKALSLYQESLAFLEQIGDIQGKAASLHNLAHVYIQRGQTDLAEPLLAESLRLNQILNQPEGIAFVNVTLGQLVQARGNLEMARQHYSEALYHFQKLGMTREVAQVERILASLSALPANEQEETDLEAFLAQLPPEERAQAEAQWQAFQQRLAAMSDEEKAQIAAQIAAQSAIANRLQQAVRQARAAAERQLWPAAISYQQEAVAQVRTLAQSTGAQEALVQLSILLYNLAGYYQRAHRHPEAVACYEEVVALDEQTGHEDLASDHQALAQARQLAAAQAAGALEPGETVAIPAGLEAWLAQLSPQERARLAQMGPEDRERLLEAMARFASLPEEEQAAIASRALFEPIETAILDQLTELWAAIRAGELDSRQREASAGRIVDILTTMDADETLGPQRRELAALLRCTAAYLRGEALPPIPAAYAGQWAAWLEP